MSDMNNTVFNDLLSNFVIDSAKLGFFLDCGTLVFSDYVCECQGLQVVVNCKGDTDDK